MPQKTKLWGQITFIGALLSLAIFLLAIISITACSNGPRRPEQIAPGNYNYLKKHIAWLIRKEMKRHRVIGVSIAIVDNQRVVWAQGFGYADKKNQIPATPETVYPIGSISKLFTVTAAMQLAERGKIDIDQPLGKYLPRFSIKSRFAGSGPVTPRSIMTHHSGLPSDMPKGALTNESPSTLLDRLKDQYAAYPTNYVLAYSNVAMALLGLTVEQISKTEFNEHLDRSVFAPIGMRHSAFKPTPEIDDFLSIGYRNGNEAKHIQLRDMATGSMCSNVLDLSRFMKMLFAGGRVKGRQILAPETVVEMLEPQNESVALDFDQRIGLGWFLTYAGKKGLKIGSHGGNMPLFHTSLAIVPEEKIGVIVLTNSAEGRKIYDKISGEALKLAIEAKTGDPLEKREHKIAPPDKIASEETLQKIVGRYATINMLGSVERNEKNIIAHVDGYRVQLVPSSSGGFGVEKKWLGLFSQKRVGDLELSKIRAERVDVAGRKLLRVRYDGRHWFIAEKIKPFPLPEAWKKALGKYEVINPDPGSSIQDVTLSSSEDLLVFTYTFPVWGAGKRRMYLSSISESEAITLGIGRNSGETMRIVDLDDQKGIYFLGFKMKKISS